MYFNLWALFWESWNLKCQDKINITLQKTKNKKKKITAKRGKLTTNGRGWADSFSFSPKPASLTPFYFLYIFSFIISWVWELMVCCLDSFWFVAKSRFVFESQCPEVNFANILVKTTIYSFFICLSSCFHVS